MGKHSAKSQNGGFNFTGEGNDAAPARSGWTSRSEKRKEEKFGFVVPRGSADEAYSLQEVFEAREITDVAILDEEDLQKASSAHEDDGLTPVLSLDYISLQQQAEEAARREAEEQAEAMRIAESYMDSLRSLDLEPITPSDMVSGKAKKSNNKK